VPENSRGILTTATCVCVQLRFRGDVTLALFQILYHSVEYCERYRVLIFVTRFAPRERERELTKSNVRMRGESHIYIYIYIIPKTRVKCQSEFHKGIISLRSYRHRACTLARISFRDISRTRPPSPPLSHPPLPSHPTASIASIALIARSRAFYVPPTAAPSAIRASSFARGARSRLI